MAEGAIEWITVTEAAQASDYTQSRIYQLIADNAINYKRVGNRVLINKTDFEGWANAMRFKLAGTADTITFRDLLSATGYPRHLVERMIRDQVIFPIGKTERGTLLFDRQTIADLNSVPPESHPANWRVEPKYELVSDDDPVYRPACEFDVSESQLQALTKNLVNGRRSSATTGKTLYNSEIVNSRRTIRTHQH